MRRCAYFWGFLSFGLFSVLQIFISPFWALGLLFLTSSVFLPPYKKLPFLWLGALFLEISLDYLVAGFWFFLFFVLWLLLLFWNKRIHLGFVFEGGIVMFLSLASLLISGYHIKSIPFLLSFLALIINLLFWKCFLRQAGHLS